MSAAPAVPDTIFTTEPDVDESTQVRRLPPYNLILHNDDWHSFEFVVAVLCKALGYAIERSYQYMVEAHNSGRAVVWTGQKEVAELKLEQVRTFHEVRESDGAKLGPLDCGLWVREE